MADEALGPHEIAIAIGTKRNNIDQLLYKMAKAGEVLKARRGRYIHPSRTDLIALDRNEPHGSVDITAAKFLGECGSGGSVLN